VYRRWIEDKPILGYLRPSPPSKIIIKKIIKNIFLLKRARHHLILYYPDLLALVLPSDSSKEKEENHRTLDKSCTRCFYLATSCPPSLQFGAELQQNTGNERKQKQDF